MCFLGQAFFVVVVCFNSQLGKASEVTLEKCMHQRKNIGGVGRVLESLCALCLEAFFFFFFPNNVSSKFPLK